MKKLMLCAILCALSACTIPPHPSTTYLPSNEIYPTLNENGPLIGKVRIGEINAEVSAQRSLIAPANFREAIEMSLRSAGYLAKKESDKHYTLDAVFVEMDRPFLKNINYFDGNRYSQAVVKFMLKEDDSGNIIFDQVTRTEGIIEGIPLLTPLFADPYIQQKQADEKALREPLAHMLRMLDAVTPSQLSAKKPAEPTVKQQPAKKAKAVKTKS